MKFFTRRGGLDKKDISEILSIAKQGNFETSEKTFDVERKEFMLDYSEYLVSYIRKTASLKSNYDKPLKGLKIIVDAGNGAGGFFCV